MRAIIGTILSTLVEILFFIGMYGLYLLSPVAFAFLMVPLALAAGVVTFIIERELGGFGMGAAILYLR